MEFKPTWLYIKQHNITGLKYFGKTTRKDPSKYLGSGIRWKNHLRKHGENISTIWTKFFTNKEDLVSFALTFSKENKIVESNEWANLKLEDGLMGEDTGITDIGREILREKSSSRKHTPEAIAKIKQARANQKNLRTGKKHSYETIEKIRAARALQKNVKGVIHESA